MSLSTGDIIDGKYRIVRLIGEGGMGAVYEGENMRIHRRVAIKVLHAGVAGSADAVQRFEREAQAAGRIGSQHIVEVLDLGDLMTGDRYLVMEYMDGDSLSERIRQVHRLTANELYPIAVQLLEGLHAAHSAGIIHRDLKPDNVYLLASHAGQRDFVKILDFGISKFSSLSSDSGFSMTRTGAVMGTPYYMSPEQAKGAKGMDHRADLYSVGVILYECVTGQVPFNADTFNELLFKIVLEEPAPMEMLAPDIDRGFADLIRRGMARDPAQRFQSAKEFQQALEAWAAGGQVVPYNPVSYADMTGPRPALSSLAAFPGQFAGHAELGSGGLGGTQGSWEAAPAPKRKSTGLIVGVAIGAVLLLGGGGWAALQWSADDSQTPASAQLPPAAPATAEPAPSPEPAPDPTAPEPESTAAAPEPSAAPAALPKPVAAPKPVVAPKPTPKPAATPKPGPKPAPAPAPGGRVIRETL
ncbi:MAG: serine/threonine protein kinase [Polyangiaceae bacterium]|nr:serine/threonine protein kinase [Polyangiaceae bacterium]MCW5791475.1 serine/threonine protein kinase [Polyangiaceae bacterium]